MSSFARTTLDRVAAVLTPSIWLTSREVQICLGVRTLSRSALRNILQLLAAERRAVVDNTFPKYYRAPGFPTVSHHCLICGASTRHHHLYDSALGNPQGHLAGTERFECSACGKSTFADSDNASDAFRFVLDGGALRRIALMGTTTGRDRPAP